MPKRIEGVALYLRNPRTRKILVLRERHNKEHLGKLNGMDANPMETSRPGEKKSRTLKRLVKEELPGLRVEVETTASGAYRIVPGVLVWLYRARTHSCRLPRTIGRRTEVDTYRWLSPNEARKLWLRQGAGEMIEDGAARRRRVMRWTCARPACLT